ncbi:MAG: hypothetical protein JWN48_713 [Myxococcaceae bacterium]|nr:hypothetical protein [Myxococcaceae bacterium]
MQVTTTDESNARSDDEPEPPSSLDAGHADAASNAPAHDAATCVPPRFELPLLDAGPGLRLSQLGLYQDSAAKQLACDLVAYQPRSALWSDGAEKQRWLRLPAGGQVDNSDPDALQFPAGTVLFKEFALDGKRLETRVLARLGRDPEATFLGAFAWLDDESDALLVSDAQSDVRGTTHDIPAASDCQTCHHGEREHVLGFSTVQQPDVPANLFSSPVRASPLTGDPSTVDALQYLHANCAHCHNQRGIAFSQTSLVLRLTAGQSDPLLTTIYQQTVGKPLERAALTASVSLRVAPGQPEASALVARMQTRDPSYAMPPLATEQPDPAGLSLVRAWIASLAPE